MGNAQGCYQKRTIEDVSEPMSDYINRCLEKYYNNVTQSADLWGSVYQELRRKLDTETFKKIQSLDPVVQRGLLMESFGHALYQVIQLDPGYENSIQLLEYWDAHGLFEKIQKLFDDEHLSDVLDFGSMKRVGTSIKILFKCDHDSHVVLGVRHSQIIP
jgi:hypothetical protein